MSPARATGPAEQAPVCKAYHCATLSPSGAAGYAQERTVGVREHGEEKVIIDLIDNPIINKLNKKYPRLLAYADNLVGSGAGLAPRTGSS